MITRRKLLTKVQSQQFDISKYFTITALEDNADIFYTPDFYKSDSSTWYLYYCINGSGVWVKQAITVWHEQAKITTIHAGDTVSFKATEIGNSDNMDTFNAGTFNCNKPHNVSGNCMSLLWGEDDYLDFSKNYGLRTFAQLLKNDSMLISASDLLLPATTLVSNCYDHMFYGCTSLTTAPELPATTLANSCYSNMFEDCTSLIAAPELPATTLANNCYYAMFYECSSLTTAPDKLPATTLVDYCYAYMFTRCSSLTTAPELPAAILLEKCYDTMFSSCTNLNYIKMLATDISASNCLRFWALGVASTGTFIKHRDMNNLLIGSPSGIPEGWTVQDATE